jgi:formyltetrahydrofolate synthetase
MKLIEEMIMTDIEKEYESYSKWQEEFRTAEHNYCEAYNKRMDKEIVDQYKKVLYTIKENKYYYNLFYKGRNTVKANIEKDIRKHYQSLQSKVEKKIGKIINIEKTGNNGFNYYMQGEISNCFVEVILAGGYNIQRLHTRWIIKK